MLAAKTLDKPEDEIFEYARDLQDSMNLAHEKGTMKDCAWTYRIWQDNKAKEAVVGRHSSVAIS